jgi:hypothetical protein
MLEGVAGGFAMAFVRSPLLAGTFGLVLGTVLGWGLHRTGLLPDDDAASRAAPDETQPDPLRAPSDAPGAAPTLEASEVARLEARWQARVKELEQQKAALAAEVETQKRAAAAAAPAPLDPKALRFGLSGATPVFDGADWTELAGHMSELAKVLPKLRDDLAAGREMGPETQSAVQQHNTPLALFAVSASKELKGSGPNGAYTHPAVIANLIRAGLIAAGDPLTAAQEQAVAALGAAWVGDAERALAAVPADAPALAKTIAEVDAKQRFLDAVKGQLTGSQRAVLFHPETEGRLGLDLLSPALVYMLHTGVHGMNAAEVADKLVATALAASGAKDVDAAALLGVGERWLSDLPWAAEPRRLRDPETMFPSAAAMQASARAQVAAIVRFAESGRLTPEQVAKLKKSTTLLLPQVILQQ